MSFIIVGFSSSAIYPLCREADASHMGPGKCFCCPNSRLEITRVCLVLAQTINTEFFHLSWSSFHSRLASASANPAVSTPMSDAPIGSTSAPAIKKPAKQQNQCRKRAQSEERSLKSCPHHQENLIAFVRHLDSRNASRSLLLSAQRFIVYHVLTQKIETMKRWNCAAPFHFSAANAIWCGIGICRRGCERPVAVSIRAIPTGLAAG
jgi:hypothetical protein